MCLFITFPLKVHEAIIDGHLTYNDIIFDNSRSGGMKCRAKLLVLKLLN